MGLRGRKQQGFVRWWTMVDGVARYLRCDVGILLLQRRQRQQQQQRQQQGEPLSIYASQALRVHLGGNSIGSCNEAQPSLA